MALFRLIPAAVAVCIIGACGYSAPTDGGSGLAPPPTATSSDISIVQDAQHKGTMAFQPNPKEVSASAGGEVRWVNNDITGGDYTMGTAVVHQIVSDNGAFQASPQLNGDETYSITLTTPGDYPYHCAIHTSEKGTIHVTP